MYTLYLQVFGTYGAEIQNANGMNPIKGYQPVN